MSGPISEIIFAPGSEWGEWLANNRFVFPDDGPEAVTEWVTRHDVRLPMHRNERGLDCPAGELTVDGMPYSQWYNEVRA